jgi:N-acetylmuramoyl-L-alanine amidase
VALLATLACFAAWIGVRGEGGPPPSLRGEVVVIDPGHGGVDGGAEAPGLRALEKELTLQVGLRLAAEVERAGAVAVLTRDADTEPGAPGTGPDGRRGDLRARVEAAAQARAAAFVSLHMDSSRLAVEPRRGPASFYGPRGAQQGRGRRLAQDIQRRFHQAFGVDARAWPLNVYVLRENPVPAALVECAFLNNPDDLARILRPAYQEELVRAIAAGLADYLGGPDRRPDAPLPSTPGSSRPGPAPRRRPSAAGGGLLARVLPRPAAGRRPPQRPWR